MVLFGSSAPLLVDINLILQYASLVLLIVGYVKRKPYKTHGNLMIVVLLLTVGTTVLIMAPRLLGVLSIYGDMVLVHAGIGVMAMILGTLFALNFAKALQTKQPLTCGTKNMMRLALILWTIPILFGTFMYTTLYQ